MYAAYEGNDSTYSALDSAGGGDVQPQPQPVMVPASHQMQSREATPIASVLYSPEVPPPPAAPPAPAPRPAPHAGQGPNLSPQQQLQLLAIAQQQQQQMSETALGVPAGPGFCERMWGQRRDMNKLMAYSAVIIAALAIHSTIQFYLTEFVQPDLMPAWQQFAARMVYPVGVVLLLWVIRAHSSRSG